MVKGRGRGGLRCKGWGRGEGGATIHRVGWDGSVKVGEGGKGEQPSTEIFHKGNFSLSRI